VNLVKLGGIGLPPAYAFLRNHAKARFFELGNYFARNIPHGGIGFNDRKRAFDWHGRPYRSGAICAFS
jgi:hypothetical protein